VCQRDGVDASHAQHVEPRDVEAAVLACTSTHQRAGEVLELSLDGDVVCVAATGCIRRDARRSSRQRAAPAAARRSTSLTAPAVAAMRHIRGVPPRSRHGRTMRHASVDGPRRSDGGSTATPLVASRLPVVLAPIIILFVMDPASSARNRS
jgi:hypothetical protein